MAEIEAGGARGSMGGGGAPLRVGDDVAWEAGGRNVRREQHALLVPSSSAVPCAQCGAFDTRMLHKSSEPNCALDLFVRPAHARTFASSRRSRSSAAPSTAGSTCAIDVRAQAAPFTLPRAVQ